MSTRRHLLSSLMAGNSTENVRTDKFYVKGSTGDFNDRQRDIFGRLSTLEEKHNEVQKETVPDEKEDKSTENEIDPPDFVVPLRPPIRRKPMPSYVKNPQRWTKYSLADVSADQMSDKSNTTAALDFLAKRKRELEDDDHADDNEDGAVQFSKPKRNRVEEDDSTKVEFRSGKWKMPEYVVGQEKKNNTRKSNKKPDSESSFNKVQLGHLQDEIDSDDGDGDEEKPQTQTFVFKSKRNLRKREENE